MKSLTEKLSIEWNLESVMTPQMRELYSLYSGNELIAKAAIDNLVRLYDNNKEHPLIKYIDERKLTKDDIIKYELGTIDVVDALRILSEAGINRSLCTELGVNPANETSKRMFNEQSLLFVLRNIDDRVVAFSSRSISYETNNTGQSKYVNTHSNRIFEKKKFLYNLNNSKMFAQRDNNIFVYEGFMDVIRSVKAGIQNCVAICGTSFSEFHAEVLRKNDINNITFALDGDKAGNNAVLSAVENIFSDNKSVNCFIKEMPDGLDPDDLFLTETGLQQFNEIKSFNIIEYKIKTIFKDAKQGMMNNVEDAIENFFNWLIKYETNPIKRLRCLAFLSEQTNHSVSDLRKQLEYQDKIMSDDTAKEVNNIWYDMISNGKSSILRDRINILDRTREQLTRLMINDENIDVVTSQIEVIDNAKNEFKNNTITQVLTGWQKFDECIMIPKESSLIMVGAYPNVGKSILMRNIALRVIQNNPDLSVIYFSMDDPLKATIPAMVANLIRIPINDIRYQNLIKNDSNKSKIVSKIDDGFSKLKEMMNEQQLFLYDQNNVLSMSDIETNIDVVMNRLEQKKRKPVVIVDSLHSISMDASSDRRLEVMSHIRDLRRIANTRHIPVFGVSELRKGQSGQKDTRKYKRATLRDMAETGDIEYRVTVGIILENELKELGDASNVKKWSDVDIDPCLSLPVLTMHVDKNKEGYFQGELNYKTNPIYSQMTEMTEDELKAMYDTIRSAGA
jgi:DNA primase catalytic core